MYQMPVAKTLMLRKLEREMVKIEREDTEAAIVALATYAPTDLPPAA